MTFVLRSSGDEATVLFNSKVPFGCQGDKSKRFIYTFMCDIVTTNALSTVELHISAVSMYQTGQWQCRGDNNTFSNWINLHPRRVSLKQPYGIINTFIIIFIFLFFIF